MEGVISGAGSMEGRCSLCAELMEDCSVDKGGSRCMRAWWRARRVEVGDFGKCAAFDGRTGCNATKSEACMKAWKLVCVHETAELLSMFSDIGKTENTARFNYSK